MTNVLKYLKRTKMFYEGLNQSSSVVKKFIENIDKEIEKIEKLEEDIKDG